MKANWSVFDKENERQAKVNTGLWKTAGVGRGHEVIRGGSWWGGRAVGRNTLFIRVHLIFIIK